MKKQKIVTIGGGTGSFMLLTGLSKYPVDLSAIVNMVDDGGSTGILRDELGVLPPGDIRQCLVALSDSNIALRNLFNYRYDNGRLSGHSFGNIFLSTLEKVTGNINLAIKEAGKILGIKGEIIPVTLDNATLVAKLINGKKITGEHKIDDSNLEDLKELCLQPKAKINKEATKKIKEADKIIINPGNLFCSIIPNFLVEGFTDAFRSSKAKKIYVCNLMTKSGHTSKFSLVDYIEKIENYLGGGTINFAIYNNGKLKDKFVKKYLNNNEYFVKKGSIKTKPHIKFIEQDLISNNFYKNEDKDLLKRTVVRHDSDKIAKLIFDL